MEEEKDDSKLDQYTQKHIDDGIQELQTEKELKIKWRKELEENESFQTYLRAFKPTSNDSFLNNYLNKKYSWYQYSHAYKVMFEKERFKWIVLAHKHLEIILQKKLFDLQCAWRAELVKLDGVEFSYDFNILQHDICNCTFLEPISDYDVELYQEFLEASSIEDFNLFYYGDWQNYNEIKYFYETEDPEEQLPEWYEYHNTRTGNAKLLMLPNHKGDKETFYTQLSIQKGKELKQQISEEQVLKGETPVINMDRRPTLNAFDENIIEYVVKNFDSKEAKSEFQYYQDITAHYDERDDDYDEKFRELLDAKELVPIEAHHDFKEAIALAHRNYTLKKLSEHLPLAHQQYLLNKQMGFSVEKGKNPYTGVRPVYAKMILDGRELNGEPRDFDY